MHRSRHTVTWAWVVALVILLSRPACVRGQSRDVQGWRLAEPGYQFHFPADHGPHLEFRTEWWYFTGNLTASNGQAFGFELTFFRHGYGNLRQTTIASSPFATGDVKFVHFTVTDVQHKRFYAAEKTSRGAFGEAGFTENGKLVWVEDWNTVYDGHFRLQANDTQHGIDLDLVPLGQPVLEGDRGFSRKAEGAGRASYYYSVPVLQAHGTVQVKGTRFQVSGTAWFDREWATNQLDPTQAGWDWFAIQLGDGSSLMLYRMRRQDGESDPFSSGKYIAADGSTTDLGREDFQMTPTRFWQRKATAPQYPVGWTLSVPKLQTTLQVSTPVDDQELALSVHYWEGCIRVSGSKMGKPASGVGYMELTGYENRLQGMSPR
ncbi:MAG TPA: lipocalin-like domain-containing protein [Chthoniobacterales bacterium]